jgi:iron complex outermembrane recepter protein
MQMGLFGTNLTDSVQISSIAAQNYPTEPGDLIYLGRPRTIGVRLQRSF